MTAYGLSSSCHTRTSAPAGVSSRARASSKPGRRTPSRPARGAPPRTAAPTVPSARRCSRSCWCPAPSPPPRCRCSAINCRARSTRRARSAVGDRLDAVEHRLQCLESAAAGCRDPRLTRPSTRSPGPRRPEGGAGEDAGEESGELAAIEGHASWTPDGREAGGASMLSVRILREAVGGESRAGRPGSCGAHPGRTAGWAGGSAGLAALVRVPPVVGAAPAGPRAAPAAPPREPRRRTHSPRPRPGAGRPSPRPPGRDSSA